MNENEQKFPNYLETIIPSLIEELKRSDSKYAESLIKTLENEKTRDSFTGLKAALVIYKTLNLEENNINDSFLNKLDGIIKDLQLELLSKDISKNTRLDLKIIEGIITKKESTYFKDINITDFSFLKGELEKVLETITEVDNSNNNNKISKNLEEKINTLLKEIYLFLNNDDLDNLINSAEEINKNNTKKILDN